MAEAKNKAEKRSDQVENADDLKIEDKTDEKKPLAKAGKRSAKAVKETAEKDAKEDRKAAAKADEPKPKVHQKPPRSREERAGKKYRTAAQQIDKNKAYSLAEAVELAVKSSLVKFDATVDVHINLAVDPKQADQNIRATVSLPAGSGKTVRVAVFAEGEDIKKAESAGAEIAGGDNLLAQLDKEQMDFDILITTPAMMPRLAKYARLLGPKGLMPNPKSGTVAADISKAVSEAKTGRIEYRVDSAGIIHLGIGKVSFGAAKIQANLEAILASLQSVKPSSVKWIFIKSAYLATTMGPAIRLNI